jgi:hypothetical protein
VYRPDELEATGVIRDLVQRFARRSDQTDDPRALKAEIERLQSQNDKLKKAMRHCIDCEYRVEVTAARAGEGRTAGGGA